MSACRCLPFTTTICTRVTTEELIHGPLHLVVRREKLLSTRGTPSKEVSNHGGPSSAVVVHFRKIKRYITSHQEWYDLLD